MRTSIEWEGGVARAGGEIGFTLRFQAQMVIRPGEYLVVGLPYFFVPSYGGVVELFDTSGAGYGASLANATDERCVLEVLQSLMTDDGAING